jgi:hypothetical protein
VANVDYMNGFVVLAASATQGPFQLRGGLYAISLVAASTSGTVSLQKLSPDGSTFMDIGPTTMVTVTNQAITSYAVVRLPPCRVQLALLGGATGVNCEVLPINS